MLLAMIMLAVLGLSTGEARTRHEAAASESTRKYTCAEVRVGAAVIGIDRLIEIARGRGASASDIRWVRWCVNKPP